MPSKSPMNATDADVMRMGSDNHDTRGHWILLRAEIDSVTLCRQRSGERATAAMEIPRAEFNKLVRWYIREQKLLAPKRKKK